jgi:hypothetical protein
MVKTMHWTQYGNERLVISKPLDSGCFDLTFFSTLHAVMPTWEASRDRYFILIHDWLSLKRDLSQIKLRKSRTLAAFCPEIPLNPNYSRSIAQFRPSNGDYFSEQQRAARCTYKVMKIIAIPFAQLSQIATALNDSAFAGSTIIPFNLERHGNVSRRKH